MGMVRGDLASGCGQFFGLREMRFPCLIDLIGSFVSIFQKLSFVVKILAPDFRRDNFLAKTSGYPISKCGII
jgi:hypothetical protein